MKIIDTDNKIRNISNIKKAVYVIKDKDNNEIKEDFIEVMIKGKGRSWIQFYPLDEFKKFNPKVRI